MTAPTASRVTNPRLTRWAKQPSPRLRGAHRLDQPGRFFDNPFVKGAPHIRFYACAPLSLPGGDRVGTLCLIDTAPRTWTADMRDTLIALKRANEALVTLERSVSNV